MISVVLSSCLELDKVMALLPVLLSSKQIVCGVDQSFLTGSRDIDLYNDNRLVHVHLQSCFWTLDLVKNSAATVFP